MDATVVSPRSWSAGTEVLLRGETQTLRILDQTQPPQVLLGEERIPVRDAHANLRPMIQAWLQQLAKRELPPRVAELAAQHQLKVGRITIRNQSTRWGSCSSRGSLSLNWRLIQTPDRVRDYIILHELMHLREMNHSPRFWSTWKKPAPTGKNPNAGLKSMALNLDFDLWTLSSRPHLISHENPRPTLYSYNTVERLLRGDFYHTVDWQDVAAELTRFPKDWPLIGIGTTNWFKRNGETIVQGNVAHPRVFWSDPEGDTPMQIIDLEVQHPSPSGPELISPSLATPSTQAAYPFLAVAVCQPETLRHWECPATDNVHLWIQETLARENIGLAAVQIQGPCTHLRFASAFYLPLEGLKLVDGYNAKNNLKLASHEAGTWNIGGIYAANPTLQNIISVEGLPLHLHGYEESSRLGGHIIQIQTHGLSVRVWPLKDLVMQLHNLDVAWQPIRNLALKP
ncbi:MAG: DUF45 domain-containing protein [Blastochloris sp.]|nr:DUF45 domain-containing protein [Blastochloris sp.]